VSRSPSSGRLYQAVALGHAAVGAAIYRRELAAIGRDGILAGVPYKGSKATAFWFLIPSPLLWMTGRLLERAERAGDVASLRSACRLGVAIGLLGVLCMPFSGFWGLLAISLRGLREARRGAR
jgi:Family of unknown function (DUF6463)